MPDFSSNCDIDGSGTVDAFDLAIAIAIANCCDQSSCPGGQFSDEQWGAFICSLLNCMTSQGDGNDFSLVRGALVRSLGAVRATQIANEVAAQCGDLTENLPPWLIALIGNMEADGDLKDESCDGAGGPGGQGKQSNANTKSSQPAGAPNQSPRTKDEDLPKISRRSGHYQTLPFPSGPTPVFLATGDKVESVTDLSVALPGGDFTFRRSYTSSLDSNAPGLVGNRWTTTEFMYIVEDTSVTNGDVTIYGPRAHEYHVYSVDSTGLSWRTAGPSTQYFTRTTATVGGTTYNVWRLHTPGNGYTDFVRRPTSGTDTLTGSLLQHVSGYGRRDEYEYIKVGTNETPRPVAIYAGMFDTETREQARAVIFLNWHFTGSSDVIGRLSSIEVYRKDAGGNDSLTNRVMYTYRQGGDGLSADLGTAGDLVQVVEETLTDSVDVGGLPMFYKQVTQYRYHTESYSPGMTDPRLTVAGGDHQLKSVIMPEQVEYFAQKFAAGDTGSIETRLERAAAYLMTLGDGDAAFTEGSTTRLVVDLAAKIVNYSTSGTDDGRVQAQYLQAACGCSSGAVQGVKEEYEYFWHSSGQNRTTLIKEFKPNTSSYIEYRRRFIEMKLLGGTPYIVARALEEVEDGSRMWVTAFKFDYDAGTGAGTRTLLREFTPSAIAGYTPATSSTAPSGPTFNSTGLVYAYGYGSGTTASRLTEIRVGAGDHSSLSSYDKLMEISYDSNRPWLPSQTKRFRSASSSAADDTEVTTFEYVPGSSSSENIRAAGTKVERELSTENGPATGPTTYDRWIIFNALGQPEWVRDEEFALIKFTYEAKTGQVATVTRNSNDSGFDYTGLPDSSGWGRESDGGALTTSFTYDRIGRRTSTTLPGNVSTYTRFELRAAQSRPGLLYRAHISLPMRLDSALFDGPARINWTSASGSTIAAYDAEVIYPAGSPQLYSLGAALGYSTTHHSHIGLALSTTEWANIADGISYTTEFTYDAFGRPVETLAANGTVSQAVYDALDRPIESKTGTSSLNLVTTEKYYYDSGTTTTSGVGNGNLTLVQSFVDSSPTNARNTVTVFDGRDRAVAVIGPDSPYQVTAYDNLNRPTHQALVSSTTYLDTPANIETHLISDPTVSERGLFTTSHYSQRGLVFRTEAAIDPSDTTNPDAVIGSDVWFDKAGRVLTTRSPNGPVSKVVRDGHGRVTAQYVVDKVGSGYADATSATSSVVIEQTMTRFNTIGLPDFLASLKRAHDAGSATGPLTTNGIASYVGYYYDLARRLTHTVNFGTAASTDVFRNGTSPASSWPPSGVPTYSTTGLSDTLISSVSYNSRGLVARAMSPELRASSTEHRVTAYQYDDLGRRFAIVENATFTDDKLDISIIWEYDSDLSDDRWVVSGWPNPTSSDENRVTTSVFDEAGNIRYQVAHYPTSTGTEKIQATEYVYGTAITGSGPSNIASKDLLAKVHYPNTDVGSPLGVPSTAPEFTVSYAYNAQGELTSFLDQNQTHHVYTRDALGRATSDAVTLAPGSSIDNSIVRIDAAFDAFGRLDRVTSFDDTNAEKNEVKFTYNPLWQVQQVRQDPTSEVDVGGDTRVVEYRYAQSTRENDNYSRVSKLIYPSADEVRYSYGLSGSVSDLISRAEQIELKDPSASRVLASYQWIGLDMPALVDYEEIDVLLDRRVSPNGGRTSGEYPGFDRFGRIVMQQWVDGDLTTNASSTPPYNLVPNKPQIFAEAYTYDRNSNRRSKRDLRFGASVPSRDFEFQYDGLDRLVQSRRGVANTSGVVTTMDKKSQGWTLDMLGNWTTFVTETDGDGDLDTNDQYETRAHNEANEITAQTPTSAGPTLPFSYDDAGNIATMERGGDVTRNLKHDAWNRLVEVWEIQELTEGTAQSEIVSNRYNGLHWRIASGNLASGQHEMYYSAAWQLLEDRVFELVIEEGLLLNRTSEYVWGLRYIDDCIAHRVAPEEGDPSVYWHLTDVQFSTVAILDEEARTVERISYQPYGEARHHPAGDVNGDGRRDSTDIGLFIFPPVGGELYIGDAGYDPELDVNRDGYFCDCHAGDLDLVPSSIPMELTAGQISDPEGPSNVIGYDGYMFEPQTRWYAQRFRWYEPVFGIWIQRDPCSWSGTNLYQHVGGNPSLLDPLGLIATSDQDGPEKKPNPSETVVSAEPQVREIALKIIRIMCAGNLDNLVKRKKVYERSMLEQMLQHFLKKKHGGKKYKEEVSPQIDRGCIGLCAAYQNNADSRCSPESDSDTKCFMTEAEADTYQCPDGKSDRSVFIKQGDWRNGKSPKKSKDGSIPSDSVHSTDDYYNYIVVYTREDNTKCYVWMNFAKKYNEDSRFIDKPDSDGLTQQGFKSSKKKPVLPDTKGEMTCVTCH